MSLLTVSFEMNHRRMLLPLQFGVMLLTTAAVSPEVSAVSIEIIRIGGGL